MSDAAAEQPALTPEEIEEILGDVSVVRFLNAYVRLYNDNERLRGEIEQKGQEIARLREQLEQAHGRATIKAKAPDEIELDEDDEI